MWLNQLYSFFFVDISIPILYLDKLEYLLFFYQKHKYEGKFRNKPVKPIYFNEREFHV